MPSTPEHRVLEQTKAGWLERLLMRVFRYRDIGRDGKLYMRRFYLTPRSWRWRFFLHHIVRPDSDPDVHDHPWSFRSWLLPLSWYTEMVVEDCYCCDLPVCDSWGTVSWLNTWPLGAKRKATYRHRIERVSRGGAWTLVLASPGEREWGFWVGGKWVPWYQYLNVPNDTAPEDRVR